ncbi:MAG: hypothetical protein F6K28_53220 [Microcoleus sp. SIO2G3]|nr:hypothetical protein [Microcoleus sp. SIO2G3]
MSAIDLLQTFTAVFFLCCWLLLKPAKVENPVKLGFSENEAAYLPLSKVVTRSSSLTPMISQAIDGAMRENSVN